MNECKCGMHHAREQRLDAGCSVCLAAPCVCLAAPCVCLAAPCVRPFTSLARPN